MRRQVWKIEEKLKESYRIKENRRRTDFQRSVEAKEKKLENMLAEVERLKQGFDFFTAQQTSNLHSIWNTKFQELAEKELKLNQKSEELQIWEDRLVAVEHNRSNDVEMEEVPN